MNTEQFEDKEMSAEVQKMIALGLLEKNWGVGANKQKAAENITQRSSDNPPGPFDDEDMNEEVRNMIALGLLENDWADGLNKQEAGSKLNQVLSTGEALSEKLIAPFEDEDMNEEVRNMIALGLLETDWAIGLNNQEAGNKFNQILSKGEAPENAVAISPSKKLLDFKNKRGDSAKNKIYKLKALSPEDPVYQQILADFKNSKLQNKIQAIQRVENEKQKKCFEDEKQFLKFQLGDDFDLNVKDLYHGTKAPKKLICSYGFDVRLSRRGLFGNGIYFSDNVKKCEKYLSESDGSSVYLCSIILGDMKIYPDKVTNTQLKTEPEKENGDRYHSVKGNVDGFNEYVIYENRRSLIKYRIVLEGTEEEDDDEVDEEVAKRAKEENELEAWRRHVTYMVNSCKHDIEEDEENEQEIRNIEKVRLEVRWRRERNAGKPVTKLTYDLLRKERQIWKSHIDQSNRNNSPSPPPVSPEYSASGGESPVVAIGNQTAEDDLDEVLQQVFDSNLSSFLELTMCENTELAQHLLMKNNGVLDKAIDEYYNMM